MSYLRFVCLLASTLTTAAVLMAVAQSPALQRGVSVQMAVTSNAQPVPSADDEDAWVVTVTDTGKLFFGARAVTSAELMEEMKINPRRRDQTLYIKADARAPFADVKMALDAARVGLFDTPVLLTAQPEHPQPGTMVQPKGLPVRLSPPASSEAMVVEVHAPAAELPAVEVNHQQIPWQDLHNNLIQIFQNRSEKLVVVTADDQLPFAQVARVIDVCRSTGATVLSPEPRNQ
jgi:biopolymer transport protein ExbD